MTPRMHPDHTPDHTPDAQPQCCAHPKLLPQVLLLHSSCLIITAVFCVDSKCIASCC